VLDVESAVQIVLQLEQHALAELGGLNGGHTVWDDLGD
jgi:hypothetical protein